jgi:hypothetical protein
MKSEEYEGKVREKFKNFTKMENHAHSLHQCPWVTFENFKVPLFRSPMAMDLASLFLCTSRPFSKGECEHTIFYSIESTLDLMMRFSKGVCQEWDVWLQGVS